MPSSLKLWPEQRVVYDFAIKQDATALFCEQRTGKTYVTMALLRKLAGDPINLTTGEGNDFCGILVGLLSNLESTWLDGFKEFLPWLSVTSDWEEFKKLPSPRLLLIHYEALPGLIKKLVRYKKFNWACVDEAHRLASRGNKASRAMARLNWIRRKIILTGTPMDKRPTELFGQFRFLAPEVFGTNWEKFEKRFLVWPVPRGMDRAKMMGGALLQKKLMELRILKSKAQFNEDRRDEFNAAIKPYAIRLTKEDAGILAPNVHKVTIPMSRRQARLYEKMEKDSFVHLGGGARSLAPLVITNIMKRRQIASGFIYDDDEELHHLSNRKLKKTLELVDELKKPIVVFTAFRPDGDLVTQALRTEGYDVAQVNGKTPRKKSDRAKIWRAFQRAEYDVLVVQTKTGGVGVDLWRSSNAIMYSMSHSFRDWDQAKSRLDNKQKTAPSDFFVLCAENTVDEELHELVIVKEFNADQVLQHLKGETQWPKRKPLKKHPRRLKSSNTRSPTSSKTPASSPRRSGSRSGNSTSRRPANPTAGTRRKIMTKSSAP